MITCNLKVKIQLKSYLQGGQFHYDEDSECGLSPRPILFHSFLRKSYLFYESDIIISTYISFLTLDLYIELPKEYFYFEVTQATWT